MMDVRLARTTFAFLLMASFARADADGDGVRDSVEQKLIEQFRPRFHVSTEDCAVLPAAFQPFSFEPRVQERNGTLYARVSPSSALGPSEAALEVHYFHLWERDCGPLSPHPLDVEHVSALLVEQDNAWRALYWYAAAHENTVCDTSNAARAEALGAMTSGPEVWVSKGKHGSFLNRGLCSQRGCGVDQCREMVALPDAPIVNLGEEGSPLDGAIWITSSAWPLAEKLDSDFDGELVAKLEASEPVVLERVNGSWRTPQFSMSIGADTLGALGLAGRHGGGGVAHAEQHTESALGKTFRAVGRAFDWIFQTDQ